MGSLPHSLGADAAPVPPALPAPALRRPGRRGSSCWVAPEGHRRAWDRDTRGQRHVGRDAGGTRTVAAYRQHLEQQQQEGELQPGGGAGSEPPQAVAHAAPSRPRAQRLPPSSSSSRRRPAYTGARRPEAGAEQFVPARENETVSGAQQGEEPRAPHSPRVLQPPQHRGTAILLFLFLPPPPPPPAGRAPPARLRRRHAAPPATVGARSRDHAAPLGLP